MNPQKFKLTDIFTALAPGSISESSAGPLRAAQARKVLNCALNFEAYKSRHALQNGMTTARATAKQTKDWENIAKVALAIGSLDIDQQMTVLSLAQGLGKKLDIANKRFRGRLSSLIKRNPDMATQMITVRDTNGPRLAASRSVTLLVIVTP